MQTRNRDRYHLRNTLDLSRITYLLTAYNGRDLGLFHAAAAESQSFATQLTIEESQCQYNNFVIRLGVWECGGYVGVSERQECGRAARAAVSWR